MFLELSRWSADIYNPDHNVDRVIYVSNKHRGHIGGLSEIRQNSFSKNLLDFPSLLSSRYNSLSTDEQLIRKKIDLHCFCCILELLELFEIIAQITEIWNVINSACVFLSANRNIYRLSRHYLSVGKQTNSLVAPTDRSRLSTYATEVKISNL